jgi:hypothetical protein
MSQSIARTAIAAVVCLALTTPGALAQMSGPMSGMGGPMARKVVTTILCPPQVTVTMAPTSPLIGGWTANTNPFPVTLDPKNLPRIGTNNTLICYYNLLNQPGAFVIYQGAGAKVCKVRADNKGFDCTT